jgi:hypothetical protein
LIAAAIVISATADEAGAGVELKVKPCTRPYSSWPSLQHGCG